MINYIIKSGDTLSGICSKFKEPWITPTWLAELNRIKFEEEIYAGEYIKLPYLPDSLDQTKVAGIADVVVDVIGIFGLSVSDEDLEVFVSKLKG